MVKVTILGAGSTIFAKNIVGDLFLTPSARDVHIALYDIDPVRLGDSLAMAENLNRNINDGRAIISSHCGVDNRRAALQGADCVVNMIQVGGYDPGTITDFEIPKKYGLRQTIGDTLGIGGIFRALRTVPVVLDCAFDMEAVCPEAWFLNYVNPLCMVTGALLRGSGIKTVGLCHSVQWCVETLLKSVGLEHENRNIKSEIAGINHMAWLLSITEDGKDLYPEIKRLAREVNGKARAKGAEKHNNMLRLEVMLDFGYYITESSEHYAEYTPYWLKSKYPDLVEEFNIPLDEYPRRCIEQAKDWEKMKGDLVGNNKISHVRSHEYCVGIINGLLADEPYRFWGNVLNDGFISNLPGSAIVEVPCYADGRGISGAVMGSLPEQCAALNRTNINVQLMVLEAYFNRSKDALYQAAMLDPHTSSELSIDDIKKMCDEMIVAHGDYMPDFFKVSSGSLKSVSSSRVSIVDFLGSGKKMDVSKIEATT